MKVVRTYGKKSSSRVVKHNLEKKSFLSLNFSLSDSSATEDSDFAPNPETQTVAKKISVRKSKPKSDASVRPKTKKEARSQATLRIQKPTNTSDIEIHPSILPDKQYNKPEKTFKASKVSKAPSLDFSANDITSLKLNNPTKKPFAQLRRSTRLRQVYDTTGDGISENVSQQQNILPTAQVDFPLSSSSIKTNKTLKKSHASQKPSSIPKLVTSKSHKKTTPVLASDSAFIVAPATLEAVSPTEYTEEKYKIDLTSQGSGFAPNPNPKPKLKSTRSTKKLAIFDDGLVSSELFDLSHAVQTDKSIDDTQKRDSFTVYSENLQPKPQSISYNVTKPSKNAITPYQDSILGRSPQVLLNRRDLSLDDTVVSNNDTLKANIADLVSIIPKSTGQASVNNQCGFYEKSSDEFNLYPTRSKEIRVSTNPSTRVNTARKHTVNFSELPKDKIKNYEENAKNLEQSVYSLSGLSDLVGSNISSKTNQIRENNPNKGCNFSEAPLDQISSENAAYSNENINHNVKQVSIKLDSNHFADTDISNGNELLKTSKKLHSRRSRLAHFLNQEKDKDYAKLLSIHQSIVSESRESLNKTNEASSVNELSVNTLEEAVNHDNTEIRYSLSSEKKKAKESDFIDSYIKSTRLKMASQPYDYNARTDSTIKSVGANSNLSSKITEKLHENVNTALGSEGLAGIAKESGEIQHISFNPFTMKAKKRVILSNILDICGQSKPIRWDEFGLSGSGLLDDTSSFYENNSHIKADLDVNSKYDPTSITNGSDFIETGAKFNRSLTKIGEASYSEVFSGLFNAEFSSSNAFERIIGNDIFKTEQIKATSAYPTTGLANVAVKVIPFGSRNVLSPSGDIQPTLGNLYQEIVSSYSLSWIADYERACLLKSRNRSSTKMGFDEKSLGSNFVKVYKACICQGEFPKSLLDAWDDWKLKNSELCLNKRPDFYPKSQLYAILILEYGGEPLETAKLANWKQAQSIMRQLSLSLALAEHLVNFEHRDLHWGNIMIKQVDPKISFLYRKVTSTPVLGNDDNSTKKHETRFTLVRIPSYGVQCTIIDYTLSRLDLGILSSFGADPSADRPLQGPLQSTLDFFGSESISNIGSNSLQTDQVFFVNLKDSNLFKGTGDIQFEVYRQMLKVSSGKWQKFYPKTNILWLVYVLEKLLYFKSRPTSKKKLTVMNLNEHNSELLVHNFMRFVQSTMVKTNRASELINIGPSDVSELAKKFSNISLDTETHLEKIKIYQTLKNVVDSDDYGGVLKTALEWIDQFSNCENSIDLLKTSILMLP